MKQQGIDPVCGMSVSTQDAEAVFEYKDEEYYFCSEQCLNQFKLNPEAYAKKAHEQHEPTTGD